MTWQSYLELSLAGFAGLGWIRFGVELKLKLKFGVAIFLPGYSHPPIHAYVEANKRKGKVSVAHNPVRMSGF